MTTTAHQTPPPPLGAGGVPWLLPDWRWRRACQIVERGGYATRARDGLLVQRVVRYARASQRVCTERGLRRVVGQYPDLHLVFKLLSEPGLRPLEVRARLLAGQTDRQIARTVGLPVPAVATYADLFFDVRPRLEATSWINWAAIGLRHDRPPSLESLLLTQAWRRGPEVIPAWLDYTQHQGERHSLTCEIGRQRRAIQITVEAQQLPGDSDVTASLGKRLCYLLRHSPKTVKSQSIPGVFSRSSAQIQGEIRFCDETRGQVESPRHGSVAGDSQSQLEKEALGQVG